MYIFTWYTYLVPCLIHFNFIQIIFWNDINLKNWKVLSHKIYHEIINFIHVAWWCGRGIYVYSYMDETHFLHYKEDISICFIEVYISYYTNPYYILYARICLRFERNVRILFCSSCKFNVHWVASTCFVGNTTILYNIVLETLASSFSQHIKLLCSPSVYNLC